MSAQRQQNNQDILRGFIPLNTLPSGLFKKVCDECQIEECAKGTILFEQGDETKEFIYLVNGMIGLYAGEMEMETIVTGSEVARFAIAHHLPRKVKAVTKSKARIVRIPTHMLDMDSPKDNGQTYLVDEVEDHGGDWMTTMLQSPVFQRLPASNLQKVMMQMEEVAFDAGEVVVKQGDEADFYYIIKSGDCELIRQPSEGGRPVKLGELHSCDAFGEDALLSGNPRNVTVQMKGKGQMLRLSKANFIKLVKEPVLQYVNFEEGQDKVNGGASWLDVRGADEYANAHIEGSVNIPFFSLRMKISELRHDQLQVLVCANGRTSEAAAFLLLKFGFNALILNGGMARWEKSISGSPLPVSESSAKKENTPLAHSSNSAVGVDKGLDTKQLEEAKGKILALEKLCAQSNEQLNRLELERHDLQHQNEQQAIVIKELQQSSKIVEDELGAIRKRTESHEAEFSQALKIEKEKNAALSLELKDKHSALDKALKEADRTRESLASLDKGIENKDHELNELKLALNKAKKNEEVISKELNQSLTALKEEIAELTADNRSLESDAEGLKREIDELSQSKQQLKQQLEESSQNSSQGLLERESKIKSLELTLSELTEALDQAEKREKEAREKSEVDSKSRQAQFDHELSVLALQLEEKTATLAQHKDSISALDRELALSKEEGKNREELLNKKEMDLNEVAHQLSENKNKLEALDQSRLSLELALSEKEALLSENVEKLTLAETEKKGLTENLKQADHDLSMLSEEQSVLKKQLNDSQQYIEKLKEHERTFQETQDHLQQQKSALEKALEASNQALKESKQQAEKAEATLRELSSGKETLKSELMQRLADAEAHYETALAAQQDIEQQLKAEVNEKEQLQQDSSSLAHQLESTLNEKQQINQRLDETRQELDTVRQQGESELARLTATLQQAEDEFKDKAAAFAKLAEEKDQSARQFQEKINAFENELKDLREEKTNVEYHFQQAVSDKEKLEQALSATQTQLEAAQVEQQKTNEEFSTIQLTKDELIQEKDSECIKLTEQIEQAEAQRQQSENAFQEKLAQVDSLRVQQVTALESELKAANEQQIEGEKQLALVQSDNEILQQKVIDAEKVLSASTGDQQSLLAELNETRGELLSIKAEIKASVATNVALEEELSTSKKALEDSTSLLEVNEKRCAELKSRVETLSSEQKTDEGVFNARMTELESQLKQAEEALQLKESALQASAENLSILANEKEEVLTSIEALRQAKISGDDEATALQRKIVELEASLKQLQDDKEQLIVEANQENNEKNLQLDKQLLEAKNEAEAAKNKLDEALADRENAEKERGELEEQLVIVKAKNSGLERQIVDAQRKVSQALDNKASEERIKELEKQLDDASSMLLDLEIKLESSAVNEELEPTDQEKDELKALQSELDLVREQTEKDLQAMQAKVENSEKMNLALKKKILSMQALANQNVIPEEPVKEKKKGWWK